MRRQVSMACAAMILLGAWAELHAQSFPSARSSSTGTISPSTQSSGAFGGSSGSFGNANSRSRGETGRMGVPGQSQGAGSGTQMLGEQQFMSRTGEFVGSGADGGFIGAGTTGSTAQNGRTGGSNATRGGSQGGIQGMQGGLGGLLGGLFGGGGMGGMSGMGSSGRNSTGTGAFRPSYRAAFSYPRPAPVRVQSTLTTQLARLPGSSPRQPVQVNLEGRTAVLSGLVTSEHDRELAERLVLLEPGVDSVRNELTVQSSSAPAAIEP